ncbi:uncharacterized protein [Miscanthus floridulus]|uniref:uncharacterized protein n=1 Tax=Miscanthus floridulus TaxID=154761 RepID=UPI00345B3FC9
MAAAPPPPHELVDDVISEILLRLPPDEPQWLFRAALVCKPWLRTLSDPAFLRRYRDFHGAPPLLGLIDGEREIDTGQGPRFVPTTAVPALPIPESDAPFAFPWPFDCRHGRVLIRDLENMGEDFHVCDPVTGDRHCVPQPEFEIHWKGYNATAVFCAAAGCHHLDCRGGPFCVVIMFTDDHSETTMSAAMYSSELGAWRAPVTLDTAPDPEHHRGHVVYHRGPLIGDEIYFALPPAATIVKYDSANNFLAVVKPKPPTMDGDFVLMVMEDGSLGFAAIEDSRLHLWSIRVSSEGTAEWVRCRVIDLEKMITMAYASVEEKTIMAYASVSGFAEGVGVIFISTCVGSFMMELKSERVRKVDTSVFLLPHFLSYMSFYTPDRLLGAPADL